MLRFETDDKDLTIWIAGNTKRPADLNQEELAALKERGDARVVEVPAAKGKQTAQIEA